MRRRVLVTTTRGGAGAQLPGDVVGYEMLGGVAAAPAPGEQAPVDAVTGGQDAATPPAEREEAP